MGTGCLPMTPPGYVTVSCSVSDRWEWERSLQSLYMSVTQSYKWWHAEGIARLLGRHLRQYGLVTADWVGLWRARYIFATKASSPTLKWKEGLLWRILDQNPRPAQIGKFLSSWIQVFISLMNINLECFRTAECLHFLETFFLGLSCGEHAAFQKIAEMLIFAAQKG